MATNPMPGELAPHLTGKMGLEFGSESSNLPKAPSADSLAMDGDA